MDGRSFFFAGGGTGGHIYPSIAVAEQIVKFEPTAKIHFFISERSIDEQILSNTGFEYSALPARGFSIWPGRLIAFCTSFLNSFKIAKRAIAECKSAVVIGVGGFIAAPACFAAHKLKVPVVLLNVDIVPGRANKIIGRWANEIFLQFEDTRQYFAKRKANINVVGCPLRSGFENPEPDKIRSELGLDKNKKTLLITGASSGSENINRTVCSLLEKLGVFADDWQIVHLTGVGNYDKVRQKYAEAKIGHRVLSYFDDMPSLLAASNLVVGRSGAVSIAEYAAASVPSICMPYPYHKDKHQYLNAGKLVDAGAAVIVDDLPDEEERQGWLGEELEELMKDETKLHQMRQACKSIARLDASLKITEKLVKILDSGPKG
ncbi:MAG: UDP-N-acetylglucosamine--N-acetylmuramyl-(pentapeptide) pyrophosphoryl-undecaprenol N-acetylglucosamine transferase [Phycisphaerae bacterium]|nr:UDP-N-acetylglucosamine--N-acetylmuramyl-(pentapeptide) pyrophosphoryl-undecaprenol N-acetylglucosamine transferase [Phycisphaerae bacterium]